MSYKIRGILLVVFLLVTATCLNAANKTFTGVGLNSTFSDASKWNGNSLPGANDNITIKGVCIFNLATTIAYGNLTLGGGGSAGTLLWTSAGNTLSVGNVSASVASSVINMTNGGTLKIRGTWTSTGLTFTYGTGTVEIASSMTLPAAYTNYYNLVINGSGITVNTGVHTTINNNLTITSGTFTSNSFNNIVTGTVTATGTYNSSTSGTKTYGAVIVSNGGTFNFTDRSITINGSLENNGTLTTGTGRVTFSGSGDATISGSSTTTFGGMITINKGASTDVVEATGLVAMTAASGREMVFTQGVFKLSSASTITPIFDNLNSSPYDIASSATLWVNHSGATVSSTSSWSIEGTIRVSDGALTIGNSSGGYLAPYSGASLIMEGGTLTIGTRISQSSAVWSFNMSGGEVIVGSQTGIIASRSPFNMDNSSSSFSMTGGTIIIRRPGTAGEGFKNIATNGSGFTSGTLQLGDASTPASTTLKIETNQPIYNLTVNSANVTAQVITYSLTVSNDLTINAGTFNPNAMNINIGGDWTNDATYTASTSRVTFNGTTNQAIGGSNSATFYNLTLNNTGSAGNDVITLSKPITVSNTLTLTDGILATDATNLITLTNTSVTATNGGNAGSYVRGPIRWNGINGAGPFVFPTGKSTNKWARVAVSGITSSSDFTCEYFNSSYSSVSQSDINTVPSYSLTVVSHFEYWDVTRSSGTGSAAVTLYWENADSSRINSCAANGDLAVAHYTGGKWQNQNSSGTVAVTGSCFASSAGTVKSDTMSSFSPQTFGSTGGGGINPLPIELLSFSAVYTGSNVELKWKTASEINNDYFTVERSIDGVNYEVVGIIASKAINGNSTSVLDYEFVDLNTISGTYYYRLRQTDFDGTFDYSATKTVVIGHSGSSELDFVIAPNPNDGKQISIIIPSSENAETISITVYDVIGQAIYKTVLLSGDSDSRIFPLQFTEKLTSGVYVVTATFNGYTLSKRMVVW